jgi:hypothetical protein
MSVAGSEIPAASLEASYLAIPSESPCNRPILRPIVSSIATFAMRSDVATAMTAASPRQTACALRLRFPAPLRYLSGALQLKHSPVRREIEAKRSAATLDEREDSR